MQDLIPEQLRGLSQPAVEGHTETGSGPDKGMRKTRKTVGEEVRLLSEILKNIPSSELGLILEGYLDAVRDGIIVGTPLTGTRFTRSYQKQGKKFKRRLQDEAVLETRELQKWLTAQRQAARLENLRHQGRVETTMERLTAGTDDLKLLAQIRRERLRAEQPQRRQRE